MRRLDLVELLADIGLGGEMHSIIGQGRVEEILASKPHDRRALIEEAAGLGKFKRRRHRAELKLARVAVQVERARDLEDEVKKRLRPLALQATAAARAEKLGLEVERLWTRLASGALADAEQRLGEVEERRAAATGERRAHEERLEGVLAERHRVEEELGAAGAKHERATADLYRYRTALERIDLRRERAEDSAATLAGEAERAARLADAPHDDAPLTQLAESEAAAADAAERTRAAIAERESLATRARLAEERLAALDRSLAEGEGLPPAARALADAGERLALTSLEIDAGYDKAVAAALAWRASAVVAGSLDDGLALLERVRHEGLGSVAVLVPGAGTEPAAGPPVPGAEPLSRFARPKVGAERVAELLEGIWVAAADSFPAASAGVLVSPEGHGYDPARGELWFAGEAAESVLLAPSRSTHEPGRRGRGACCRRRGRGGRGGVGRHGRAQHPGCGGACTTLGRAHACARRSTRRVSSRRPGGRRGPAARAPRAGP